MSDYRALPPSLEARSALFIFGVNWSDDLFMFFKVPVGGLSPGSSHGVSVSVEVATDTPAGCVASAERRARASGSRPARPPSNQLPIRDGSYLAGGSARAGLQDGQDGQYGGHPGEVAPDRSQQGFDEGSLLEVTVHNALALSGWQLSRPVTIRPAVRLATMKP